jgi:outer membrane biosynthesis protein TonB
VKIARNDAVALLEALGFKTAESWDEGKLAKKLANIQKSGIADANTDLEDADLNDLLQAILETTKQNGQIEVTDEPADETPDDEEGAAQAAAPEPAAQDETEPVKPPKAAKAPKTPKPAPEPKAPRMTRARVCGMAFAVHGLTAKIDATLVGWVDTTYGKPNPKETEFCLRNAINAINGYLAQKAS